MENPLAVPGDGIRSSIQVHVMSTVALQRITALALKQFTSTLCGNRDYAWSPNSGKPPSKGYIEQKQFSREPWVNDQAVAAWKIEDYESISTIEPMARLPKPVTDGMFFDWLIGHWGVADDLKNLSINWQTGPRFGRGFIYPILEAPTGILYLGNRKPTWVS